MTFKHAVAAALALLAFAAVSDAPIAARQIPLVDLSPSSSSLATSDPDGASGGRINGLARADSSTYFAASEWGGLYKSTDTGRTWSHLDAHLATATWDVEASPADPQRVIATSFYDGRVSSFAGINVSADSGKTWTHPPTATPPAAFCTDPARREEPSAFGISFDPDKPASVYVGTNCGLAISTDSGQTWRFVDPTPADPPEDVWDAVVHHNGVIDVCGDDGHRRSTNGGATWTTATGIGLPSGRCSIAASPAEAYVLFAVAGVTIFESDDGGGSWNTQFTNRNPQGRVPFVATNPRTDPAFDLWFGDVELWRAGCRTPSPAKPGGGARCPPSSAWAGPFTRQVGGHDDVGDIAFAKDAGRCPVLFSSDGGVFFNSKATSPACHTPAWRQPARTPHSLWLFSLGGARRPAMSRDDLYFGAQDNGAFGSTDDGATWNNADCCDTFDTVASPDRVLYTTCCFSSGPPTQIYARSTGLTGGGPIATMPPGTIPGWIALDAIDRFGATAYVVTTSSGVYITKNITASPVVWTPLGAPTKPPRACSVRASGTEANPTFSVEAGTCSGRQVPGPGRPPDTLWQYTGTTSTAAWRRVQPPGGTGGFGVYAVDRHDGTRLAAAHLRPSGPTMVFSTNAGATWTTNAALDALMTGGGVFRAQTRRGPMDFTDIGPYPQPSLVAFDPADRNTIVAAAADAGLFLSRDNGATWTIVTNASGGLSNPVLPRPSFAHFARQGNVASVYVGTQGRGLWRLQYALPPHPVATPPPAGAAPNR